jgi:hypothetical protein
MVLLSLICFRRHQEGVVFKSIFEVLPFVVAILVISAIGVWLAWAAFGFLAADVPVVVKIKNH